MTYYSDIPVILSWLLHNLVEAGIELFRYILRGDQLLYPGAAPCHPGRAAWRSSTWCPPPGRSSGAPAASSPPLPAQLRALPCSRFMITHPTRFEVNPCTALGMDPWTPDSGGLLCSRLQGSEQMTGQLLIQGLQAEPCCRQGSLSPQGLALMN